MNSTINKETPETGMQANLYDVVVGQDQVKNRLRQMVNTARVPHALLFSGPEGCGNLPAAIGFAQHLLCPSATPAGACGKCKTCSRVAGLVHPDVHLAFPIAKSKRVKCSDDLISEFREAFTANPYLSLNEWFDNISAENKQPVIPVEEAGAILRKLSYTSFEGSYRLLVIWLPEKMNTETANKLLKILEEPSDKTVFILVSNQSEQLLATIRSRVQQVAFGLCSVNEIISGLMKEFDVDEAAAKEAAIMADGNFGEACALLEDNEEKVSLLATFQAFMRLALKFDAAKTIQWIDENAPAGREKHKQFLQYGLAVFRDCLMYNYGSKDLVRLSGQERQFLEKFAPFINQKNYDQLISEFNNNYYYIERNANPKILFMDLAMKTNELLNFK
jgi:DNA polymerase III subunit delta'